MYQEAVEYFQSRNINPTKFDYFDYCDFFQSFQQDACGKGQNFGNFQSICPKKAKIIAAFLQKCEQKLDRQTNSTKKWKNFLSRMEQYKKYKKQKLEAQKYISDHWDYKNQQVLFYPKLKKTLATQQGRFWKDADEDEIGIEGQIYQPNQSTFQQNLDDGENNQLKTIQQQIQQHKQMMRTNANQ